MLIVVEYESGPCSQDISGNFIQRSAQRSLLKSESAKKMPEYVFCRYLPDALSIVLKSRGFDVAIAKFDTKPMEDKDYLQNVGVFFRNTVTAPENVGRYVLRYDGTMFENNLHSFAALALLGPQDASNDQRPVLGTFFLDRDQLYDPVGANTYRLRSPIDVANLIANSLESRCQRKGIWGWRNCPDRLHLDAPRK